MVVYLAGAVGFLATAIVTGGRPPLVVFLALMVVLLGSHALLIPNFNTIAMDPMGAIAGTASAVIGTVSTAGGTVLGALLDRTFDGTVLPLAWGVMFLGTVAASLVLWAEKGRLFRPLRSPVATF